MRLLQHNTIAKALLFVIFAFGFKGIALTQESSSAQGGQVNRDSVFTRTSVWLGASNGVNLFTPRFGVDVLLGKRRNVVVGLHQLFVLRKGENELTSYRYPRSIRLGWISHPEERNHFEVSAFLPWVLSVGYKGETKGRLSFRAGIALSRFDTLVKVSPSMRFGPELYVSAGYRFKKHYSADRATQNQEKPTKQTGRPTWSVYASATYPPGVFTASFDRLFTNDPRFSYGLTLGMAMFDSRSYPQFGGTLSWLTHPEKNGHFEVSARLCYPFPGLLLAYRYSKSKSVFIQAGVTLYPSAWSIVYPGPTISIGFTK